MNDYHRYFTHFINNFLFYQCLMFFFFRNEGVINIIITIPEPVFIKSIDTEDHRHTGEHMCEIMEEIIEKYGALKFLLSPQIMQKICERLVNYLNKNIHIFLLKDVLLIRLT